MRLSHVSELTADVRRLLEFGGGSVNATEAFDDIEDTCGDPARHQLPTAPPLHIPFHAPGPTDETLRCVRRGAVSGEG